MNTPFSTIFLVLQGTPSSSNATLINEEIVEWLSQYPPQHINVTLYDINECIYIYNSILENRNNIEFINGKVKEILDKCNIKTIEYGTGWKIV